MAEFLDPNWQNIMSTVGAVGQAQMPGKYWDPSIGAWRDPIYQEAEETTGFYEGDPDAAYALAVAAAQSVANAGSSLALPAAPVNTITTVIIPPLDGGSALARMRDTGTALYGTAELGVIRFSSAALENERSGIRLGTLPRIVLR